MSQKENDSVVRGLRLPKYLWELLKLASNANDRSITDELVHRLKKSFKNARKD